MHCLNCNKIESFDFNGCVHNVSNVILFNFRGIRQLQATLAVRRKRDHEDEKVANDLSVSIVLKKTCEAANPAGENSSFIFTVCVKSVPFYNFKLVYVVLHMAVKEFFEAHFQRWRNKPF